MARAVRPAGPVTNGETLCHVPRAEERVLGASAAMGRVREWIRKVARAPTSTVLITGESGTGKDLVARALHEASARRDKPFTNITCTALSESLLESELFGHERGAFTDARERKPGLLEQSDGGTAFLDEIGDMSPAAQAKLLRFLEDKAFRRVGGSRELRPDVRVVAATNRDLEAEVERGAFREDLYYRLGVFHLRLPPLRERGEDVGLLARHFAGAFARRFGKRLEGLSEGAERALRAHSWPGNVRELRNAIERAVLLCDGPRLEATDFDCLAERHRAEGGRRAFYLPPDGVDMAALERDLVVQALTRAGGNQSRAAALLGMNRDQIRYRCEKFHLDPAAFRRGAQR